MGDAISRLRVLDLFSGVGGFALGLERAGTFEAAAFCEIEPFQRAVLAKHWPSVRCFRDVRTIQNIDFSDLGSLDVVTGGFPCQPFSTASRGRRVAEDLWPQMLRVIDLVKPKYVIAENVSRDAISVAACAMRDRAFTVTIRNISGNDLGAPHGRNRWWAIAHPHKESEFQRALDAEMAKLPTLCEGLWSAETYSRAIRVPHGVPHRVYRTESLGNAVFPQIPQVIGQAIWACASHHPHPGEPQ